MKTLEQLRTDIQNLYEQFFIEQNINPTTGIWNNAPNSENLRFAAMPHIGESYAEATKKILFVGQDIGKDEYCKENRMQTFVERQENVDGNTSNYFSMNHHIAGTYMETLYLLKENFPMVWDSITEFENSQNITVVQKLKHILPIALLSHVALTNFHKFVTVNRPNRQGNDNRKCYGIDGKILDLFFNEIAVLDPDVVWFQGDFLCNSHYERLAKEGRVVYIAHHPSYYQRPIKINNEMVYATTPKYVRLLVDCSVAPRYGLYKGKL